MDAAWTDVAQDAVKIGLGAVTGLLSNGILAKKTRDREIAEARRFAKKNDFTEVGRREGFASGACVKNGWVRREGWVHCRFQYRVQQACRPATRWLCHPRMR